MMEPSTKGCLTFLEVLNLILLMVLGSLLVHSEEPLWAFLGFTIIGSITVLVYICGRCD